MPIFSGLFTKKTDPKVEVLPPTNQFSGTFEVQKDNKKLNFDGQIANLKKPLVQAPISNVATEQDQILDKPKGYDPLSFAYKAVKTIQNSLETQREESFQKNIVEPYRQRLTKSGLPQAQIEEKTKKYEEQMKTSENIALGTTGDGVESIFKNISSKLLKEGTEEGAKKLLQQDLKLSDDVAKEFAPKFAKATEPKAIDLLLDEVDEVVKTGRQVVPDDFKPMQYVEEQVKKQNLARSAGEKSLYGKITDFLKNVKNKLVDFNAPIEDVLSEAQKEGKYTILPKADITNQIDRALRAPSIGTQFIKDNGLDVIIKEVDNLDNLEQYLIAKQAKTVAGRGIETGRDLAKDELLINAFAPKYEAYAKQVTEYSRKLLDYAVDAGLVSEDLAKELKIRYPEYVPINRIFSDAEKTITNVSTKGKASLSKQSAIQKLVGSEREIENPIESLLTKTNDVFKQGEINKTAKLLASYEKLPGNPFNLTPLRTTANVTERIDLYSQAKDLKPIQDKLYSMLKYDSRDLRKLETELNNLNKKGLKTALKETDQIVKPTLSSKIKTIIKDEELIPQAPVNFDGLNNAYSVKSTLQKEFGNFDALKTELKDGGWSRLVDIGIDKKTAQSVAKQIFKDPLFKPKVVKMQDLPVVLSSKQTKDFIANIVKDRNIDLEVIKKAIRNREPKLINLINRIEELRNMFEGVRNTRLNLFDEAKLLRDAQTRGKSTISFFDNGVKNIFETTPEIANSAKALNVQQINILGQILALPVRIAKVGITGINLPFVLSNITKDQLTAIINSKDALKTSIANPKIFLSSLFEAVGHGKVYQEMAREGALGTSFDLARGEAKNTVQQIRSGRSLGSRIKYTVTHPKELLRAVEDIVGRSEEFTRIQQYAGTKQARLAEGVSEEEAKILASRASRENTVNFARRGEWGAVLNSAFLYLNAGIQGSRTFLRNAKTKPKETATKIGLFVFAPIAGATAWNLSDPKRAEVYNDISEFEKKGNIILIPPNPTKNKDGTWNVIKIPLSQEVNDLASIPRKGIEQAYGKDPVSVKDITSALAGTLSPVETDPGSLLSTLTPQAIKPTLEGYANMNFFTGNPQVPRSMEKLSPELQAKDYTSGTARIIGKTINQSPIKVEEWIKSTIGGIGSQYLNASDNILAGLDIIPKDQIGGQNTIKAILARFSKARGGEIDKESNDRLEELITKQADENFRLKQEAEILYADLKKLPRDEANRIANQIGEKNPRLFEKLEDVANAEKLNLNYNDRLILQLQVSNGERAKFIWENLKALKTREEKNAYVQELQDKKIISDTVFDQIIELKEKNY